ncbi:MAG: 2-phosphosulfolactate phosphatase, partial [Elusimicrobiota bacterium]
MEAARIATSAREASGWRHAAAVVDVLRCSTTLCALLAGGCPGVTVYADPRLAAAASRRRPEAELF